MMKFTKIFSILLALSYCLFIIWSRLIRERLPINIFKDYNSLLVCSYFCMLISSFIMAWLYLKESLKITKENSFVTWFIDLKAGQKIYKVVKEVFIKAPNHLYEFLYKYIKIRPLIDKICGWISYYILTEDKCIIPFLLLKYLIYGFTITTFCLDIFLFQKFQWFYKSVPFLIIPLLMDIVLFAIKDLAEKNKKVIETRIILTLNDTNKYDVSINNLNLENPLLTLSEEDVNLAVQHNYDLWIDYTYGIFFYQHFKSLENKFKPYIFTIMHILFH